MSKCLIESFAVEGGAGHLVLHVDELEAEEGLLLIHQQAQEYLVALPEGQGGVADTICDRQVAFPYPCQVAFGIDAHVGLTAPGVGGEEVHVLVGPGVGDEGDDATVVPPGDLQARLLLHLAQHALVGTLVGLALAAHAYPFAVAGVVLLLHPVQHQVALAVVDIAQCRLFHLSKSLLLASLTKSINLIN